MANQDYKLTGDLKVRPAEKEDAIHLHSYCFPEKTKTQVTKALEADLAEDSQTHRLVAEVGGYPIGQIALKQSPIDPEIAQVADLAVFGPFRQLGVADHLMAAAETAAENNGVKALEIEVPTSETNVIQRYKDWGFSEKPLVVLEKVLGAGEAEEADAEATDEDTAETQPVETDAEQQELLNS